MKRVLALPIVLVLLLPSCNNEKSSALKKPKSWSEVEESLKSYAKKKGGVYHWRGTSRSSTTVLGKCGIILQCDEQMLLDWQAEEVLAKAVEEAFDAFDGQVGSAGQVAYPRRERSTGDITIRTGGLALRREAWGYSGDALVHIVGRMVSPRDDNGLGEFEVAHRSSKPMPKGTLIWITVHYFNQNAPEEK